MSVSVVVQGRIDVLLPDSGTALRRTLLRGCAFYIRGVDSCGGMRPLEVWSRKGLGEQSSREVTEITSRISVGCRH